MSLPVLTQTYEEVRRLAIAGSVVAPGDFRLKKLIPPLMQTGQKVPVFAKVGEAVSRLVEGDEKTSAAALLELTTLIQAVLYTQGQTGIEGELEPIKTIDLGRARTQTSARVLKPLQDALTTTGSGRMEIIREAYERGAFHDFRLIAPALVALDDSYPEIPAFVAEHVLPLYGPALLPELQATFDPKGRAGHARRLLLMHQFDPQGTRDYVQRALDEGSREVRIAAIRCLGDVPEDLPFLLEQAKVKAKEVRSAAFNALAKCSSDDAACVLCKAMESADLELAVEAIRTSRQPLVTKFLLDATEKQFQALVGRKEKDSKKLGAQNQRMCLLLDCLKERAETRTQELLLNMFESKERLAAVKGEPSGQDVVESLVFTMAAGPPRVQSALVDAHETLSAASLPEAFTAACTSRPREEVFRLFSPYLTAPVNEKRKDRDPAYAKRFAITSFLLSRRRFWYVGSDLSEEIETPLDPQWLDLAVKMGQSDLVQALAEPGHAGANALLIQLFHKQLGKSEAEHKLFHLIEAMIRVGHPEVIDCTIEVIKRSAKSPESGYWVMYVIPKLRS